MKDWKYELDSLESELDTERFQNSHRKNVQFFAFIFVLMFQFSVFCGSFWTTQSPLSILTTPQHNYNRAEPTVVPVITLWSSDYHISPINDVKNILKKFPNVHVIDESLSGACERMGSCSRGLKVELPIDLGKCRNQVKRKFYDAYKNDAQMKNVSAFICQHAFTLCEAFMAFGKPMIMIASTRYEIGRFDAQSWSNFNQNLKLIAARKSNFIGANNVYDQKYLEHFTGLDVQYIPNICNYVNATYSPTIMQFLIGPKHGSTKSKAHINDLRKFLLENDINVTKHKNLRDAEDYYGLTSSYKGMIFLPYQVSLMSFFEFYSMGIPIFAPSLELLIKWQQKGLMKQLSWNCVQWAGKRKCSDPSAIEGIGEHPDPNLVHNVTSISYWLLYSDYYSFPHIQYFGTKDVLLEKLRISNLTAIHEKMMKHNEKLKSSVENQWKQILRKISNAPKPEGEFESWEEAMKFFYPQAPDLDKEC